MQPDERNAALHRAAELAADYLYALNVTLDGRLLYEWVSPGFRRLFAYEERHVIGCDGLGLTLHADDAPIAAERKAALLAGRDDVRVLRAVGQSGEIRWVRDAARPEQDPEAGRVTHVYGAGFDITALKAAEANARRRASQLRLVMENVASLIAYIDSNGYYQFANRQYEIWRAEQWTDIVGRHVRDVVGESVYATQVKPHMDLALAGVPVTFEADIAVSPWGQRWMRASYVPDVDENGNVAGLFAVLSDLTEHRRAEEALQDSEARYRLLADHASDMITRHDTEGVCRYASPACRSLLGRAPSEIIGRNIFDFVHPEDLPMVHDRHQVIRQGVGDVHIRCRLRRADGSFVWVDSKSRSIRDPQSGSVVEILAITRDATEMKRAEELARSRLADLAHLSRLSTIGEMATTMAHELNQPLGAISNYAAGCAAMIRDDTGSRDTLLDAMGRIAAEARRAARVIRRTRRFVGRRERELTEVNLNDVVRDVIELLDHETSVAGVVVTADLADPAPHTVGDRVLLQQVVTNLLKNAVEALVAENIRNPTIMIQTRHSTDRLVQITVTDNGTGLTDDQLERVFDPYYTTRAEGLGLGLAICRSIIEDHGGRLTARHHDPHGTSFQFTLPSAGRAPAAPKS